MLLHQLHHFFDKQEMASLGYTMHVLCNEQSQEHVMKWMQDGKEKMVIEWTEAGFKDGSIRIQHLDEEKDQSLLRGLRFYLKDTRATRYDNLFRNHHNLMEFLEIIVAGSLQRVW